MIRKRTLLGLLIALCGSIHSNIALANWYEATGQATIEQGDLNNARRAAVEDALQRATLFAGVHLESQQQVVQGILQHHQVTLSSSADVRQVQLLSETHSKQQVFVKLKAYILPNLQSCRPQYKSSLLLSPIHLNARQDAIYGQLFQLGEHSSQQLALHLRDTATSVLLNTQAESLTPAQLDYAAAETLFDNGQRFVLLGQINDLSLGEKTSTFWQSSVRERFFSIEVWLYDTFERRIRFQQEYRTSSHWPDKDNHTPASHSMAFWRMPYGQKIDQLLQAVALDIQQQTQCQPLLAHIRQVKKQQIQLDLGSVHGLKIGDQVRLMQVQRDPQNPEVRRLLDNPFTLTITELTTDHAWASSASAQLLNHIQQGDIISIDGK